MKYLIKFLLIIIIFLFSTTSCRDDYKHPVPDVYVDLFININTHFELQSINGFIYKNDYGFNGIVIFRYSTTEFMAFDRACPHHPYEYDCKIEVQDPPIAIDECCESRYLLIDGSVVDGPSKHPLKQYRVYFDAERNYLQITN
jgi:nitrite reductase/ring-hydroxylating ferredoxin subunit